MKNIYIILITSFICEFSFSQNDTDSVEILNKSSSLFSSTPASVKNASNNLRIGGNFRFFNYIRNFQEMYPLDIANYYSGEYPQKTLISIGTGYRDPMLLMTISGSPTKDVSFGTDLILNSPFNGDFRSSSNIFDLNLGSNIYSTIQTGFAKLGFQIGGISWYRQSKLTVWAEEGYLRYSLFDRAPYDPIFDNVTQKYSQYFNSGTIEQDIRFGNVAFKGITMTGSQIQGPGNSDFTFTSILGKTQNNNTRVLGNGKDDYSYGINIKNIFSSNFIAYNYFRSSTFTDSTNVKFNYFDVNSLEYQTKLYMLDVFGEVGIGSFGNQDNSSYGTAILFNLRTPRSYTYFPFLFQFSYIEPEVVNVNSAIQNASVVDLITTTVIDNGTNPTVLAGFGGPMNSVGYLANNRVGGSLSGEMEFGNLKITLAVAAYKELERISSNLSYGHIISGLFLSRISYFQTGFNPYGTFNSYYRGVYENVNIQDTIFSESGYELSSLFDSEGNMNFDKYYFASDLHLKFKGKIMNKDFYVFSLTNYNTAQDYLTLLPIINDEPFLRQFCTQIDLVYNYSERLNVLAKFGLESILANRFTDLDIENPLNITDSEHPLFDDYNDYEPSFKARHQNINQYGFGLDYKLNDGLHLYLRHFFYDFHDKNFSLNKINVSETTVELKVNL